MAARWVLAPLILCLAEVGGVLVRPAKKYVEREEGACPFDQKCGEDCIGTLYSGKTLDPEVKDYLDKLDPQKAVVWTLGNALDSSFDIGLACKYNFTVHIFDAQPNVPEHIKAVHLLVGSMAPTHPMSTPGHEACDNCVSYWDDVAFSQARAEQLVFHPKAVARSDGNVTFYESNGDSWTLDPRPEVHADEPRTMLLPSVTLSSLMREMRTPRVDFLRIQVDGHERELMDQVADLPDDARPGLIIAPLPTYSEWTCKDVIQVCLPLKEKTKAMLLRMKHLGYLMFKHHQDFTFVKAQ
mmetsp:Transcript_39866/g.113855  ORF Transcript_39866/g.113855 Transcript_39866/m.113855 type:complete len:297 (-) Transcript_39866:108-998(-)